MQLNAIVISIFATFFALNAVSAEPGLPTLLGGSSTAGHAIVGGTPHAIIGGMPRNSEMPMDTMQCPNKDEIGAKIIGLLTDAGVDQARATKAVERLGMGLMKIKESVKAKVANIKRILRGHNIKVSDDVLHKIKALKHCMMKP